MLVMWMNKYSQQAGQLNLYLIDFTLVFCKDPNEASVLPYNLVFVIGQIHFQPFFLQFSCSCLIKSVIKSQSPHPHFHPMYTECSYTCTHAYLTDPSQTARVLQAVSSCVR